MKKVDLRMFVCLLAMMLIGITSGKAERNKQTVVQVSTAVTISTAVDYHVTGPTPFNGGSVNITHPDGWLFFDSLKPSEVIAKCANNILINGEAFSNNINARVVIYGNGAVVMPHGNTYYPLTVYTEKDFGGESRNQFIPGTYYTSLGAFDNSIRSFKLKRGYMATFANNSDGSGYSRVFIASDDDLEISEMQPELRGKASFIRIFRWNWPTKKGWCGWDANEIETLGVTWWYAWDAGDNTKTDREYVPQRHHESGKSYDGSASKGAWPGWSEINGKNANVTHVLGNNEPDNTGDNKEVYLTVDQAVDGHPGLFASGLRIGCLATTSPNNYFYEFFDKCIAKGYRIDFVALHCYWANKSPQQWYNDLKYVHQRTGRPIWITEWNDGANWTNETHWPDADRSASAANQAHQLNRLKGILQVLDTAYFVERYSIYQNVQDCRKMFINGALTPAGEYYAKNPSRMAYNPAIAECVVPKAVFNSPIDLAGTYLAALNKVTLTWESRNGELADSFAIQRKKDKGEFETVYTSTELTTKNTHRDELTEGDLGVFTYRIVEYGCNGRTYMTNEVEISVSGSEGFDDFQYGRMRITNTDYTYNFFHKAFEEEPTVITGVTSRNNVNVPTTPHVRTVRTDRFEFRYFPWTVNNTYTELSVVDSTDYMVIKNGNGSFGELPYEAAAVPEKVGSEEVQVTFSTPFPEGTTPIVLATVTTSQITYPFMHRISDVTNTGFRIKLIRQAGVTVSGFPKQTVHYFAIAPGQAYLGNNKMILAKHGEEEMGKTSYTVEFDEPLTNAYYFAGLQSNESDVACILRYRALSNGTKVVFYKQIDTSAESTTAKDKMAYVIIADATASGIQNGTLVERANSLTIQPAIALTSLYVNDSQATNATIYSTSGIKLITNTLVDGVTTIDVSMLNAGTYILKTDSGNSKIFIKK